jgi:hypothetical protein
MDELNSIDALDIFPEIVGRLNIDTFGGPECERIFLTVTDGHIRDCLTALGVLQTHLLPERPQITMSGPISVGLVLRERIVRHFRGIGLRLLSAELRM